MLGKEEVVRKLVKELRRRGYVIYPNHLIEVAGVTHKLDILAIANPIPGAEVRIGFIILTRNVNPEDIEKYSTWRDEGGLDKIIVLSTGDVSIEAYEIARRLRVGITKVSEDLGIKPTRTSGKYSILHVHPRISKDEALAIFRKALGRGLLRKCNAVCKYLMIYIPFIEFEFKALIRNPERDLLEELTSTLTFDAVRGALVTSVNDSFDILCGRGSYAELTPIMIDVIRILARDGYSKLSDISLELGVGMNRLREVLRVLEEKSLVDHYSDVAEFRRTLIENSFSLIKYANRKGAEIHDGEPSVNAEDILEVLPYIDIERLMEFVEAFSAEVSSASLIYYPFYVGLIGRGGSKESGRLEYEVIDALTGREIKSITWLLSYIESILGRSLIKVS